MPTIPWMNANSADDTAEVLVMASRFEVKSLSQVPGFFMTSMKLWRQALRSKGALGVSLRADLLSRTFWTLSAWTDRAAINAYAGSEPHKSAMRRKRKVMKESTFVFWTVPASALPMKWDDAVTRINAER
ncbi:DUF3291 domain-containing protein [Nonomuraea sp. NPDC050556]|uniref:DUF3291 domain-containing protein n=1 Tax=Nonomuraea sp. NPDC050556 TaxID=3364369 RepID=UPI00378F7577